MSKILVTDDNSDYRATIIELLQLEGYEVIEADNGKLALQLMRDQMPDIILCDVDMPVMTGLEVLQAAKHNPQLKTIPFIIVTGNTGNITIEEIKQKGADAYLFKPLQIDELFSILKEFLS